MSEIMVNGKKYASMSDYVAFEKMNANSTNIIWERQHFETMIGGKMYGDAYGVCWYRGIHYEGDITYDGNKLYVGGQFVKEV